MGIPGKEIFPVMLGLERGLGALVSWTPDLQKGPGLRAGGGVEWGLENEGSEDSLSGGGGTSLTRCQQVCPGQCPGGLSAALCKSFFSGRGEGWVG